MGELRQGLGARCAVRAEAVLAQRRRSGAGSLQPPTRRPGSAATASMSTPRLSGWIRLAHNLAEVEMLLRNRLWDVAKCTVRARPRTPPLSPESE